MKLNKYLINLLIITSTFCTLLLLSCSDAGNLDITESSETINLENDQSIDDIGLAFTKTGNQKTQSSDSLTLTFKQKSQLETIENKEKATTQSIENFNWKIYAKVLQTYSKNGVEEAWFNTYEAGKGCLFYDGFTGLTPGGDFYVTVNTCFVSYNKTRGVYEMYLSKKSIEGSYRNMPPLPDNYKTENEYWVYLGNLSDLIPNDNLSKDRKKRGYIKNFFSSIFGTKKKISIEAKLWLKLSSEASRYFYKYFIFIDFDVKTKQVINILDHRPKEIQDIFENAYIHSETFRSLFNTWVINHSSDGKRIDVAYQLIKPSAPFAKNPEHEFHDGTQPGRGLVVINTAEVGNEYFAYPLPYTFGKFTLDRLFIHELIHVLTEERDLPKGIEYYNDVDFNKHAVTEKGPVVEKTNLILKEMGLPDKPRALYVLPIKGAKEVVAKYYRDEQ